MDWDQEKDDEDWELNWDQEEDCDARKIEERSREIICGCCERGGHYYEDCVAISRNKYGLGESEDDTWTQTDSDDEAGEEKLTIELLEQKEEIKENDVTMQKYFDISNILSESINAVILHKSVKEYEDCDSVESYKGVSCEEAGKNKANIKEEIEFLEQNEESNSDVEEVDNEGVEGLTESVNGKNRNIEIGIKNILIERNEGGPNVEKNRPPSGKEGEKCIIEKRELKKKMVYTGQEDELDLLSSTSIQSKQEILRTKGVKRILKTKRNNKNKEFLQVHLSRSQYTPPLPIEIEVIDRKKLESHGRRERQDEQKEVKEVEEIKYNRNEHLQLLRNRYTQLLPTKNDVVENHVHGRKQEIRRKPDPRREAIPYTYEQIRLLIPPIGQDTRDFEIKLLRKWINWR